MNKEQFILSKDNYQKLYKMGKIVNNILVKYNIQYWANGGTILGSIRNRGIIEWDDDIDICVWKKDLKRILKNKEILDDFDKLGYLVVKENNGKFNAIKVFEKNITHKIKNFGFPFLDIFSFTIDKTDRNKVIHTYKHHRELWKNDYYLLDRMYPLIYSKFGNSYIIIPNNYEEYLDKIYPEWKTKGIIYESHFLNIYNIKNPIIIEGPFLSAKNFDNTVKLIKMNKDMLSNKTKF